VLAQGDATLTATGPSNAAHTTLTLAAQAVTPACGELLALKLEHGSGNQPIFALQATLDTP
jgi:hypothetical protein